MNARHRIAAAGIALVALTPSSALADDESDSTVAFGVAEVKFRGTKDTTATSLRAEGGLDFNGTSLDGGLTTSVYVKAPAQESAASYRTRLDEFSSGWRGGLTLNYQWTDQSTRDYVAHPCMVLLRRRSTLADTRAELGALQAALAEVQAETSPETPAPIPASLTPQARTTLQAREAALREMLARPPVDGGNAADTEGAELALVVAVRQQADWAEAIRKRQADEYQAELAEFEANRAGRADEIESEIDALTRSADADDAQIRDAVRELERSKVALGSDGNCAKLPKGWKVRLRGAGELGGQTYAWRPLDAQDPLERARYSGAAQLSLDAVITDRPDRTDREQTGWVFGPSFTARYTQEWKDEDRVGVLDSTSLDPTLAGEVRVDPRVVGAPITVPTLSFRAYSYFAPPTRWRMFAFGPALAMTTVGDAQTSEAVHTPAGDKLIARGEMWFYFMPTDAETVNTRLGIAPFFDATLMGRDPEDGALETGAFVSFQVGKPVYRY